APPAEKTSARSDQAGKASTGDGAGDGRDCCPVRQRPNRTHVRINLVNIAKGPQGVTVLTWYSCSPLYVSCRLVERSPTKEDIVESNRERLGLRWIRRRRRRQGRYGKWLVEPGAIKKIPHARDCDVAREKVVEISRRRHRVKLIRGTIHGHRDWVGARSAGSNAHDRPKREDRGPRHL